MQLDLSPSRQTRAQLEVSPTGNEPCVHIEGLGALGVSKNLSLHHVPERGGGERGLLEGIARKGPRFALLHAACYGQSFESRATKLYLGSEALIIERCMSTRREINCYVWHAWADLNLCVYCTSKASCHLHVLSESCIYPASHPAMHAHVTCHMRMPGSQTVVRVHVVRIPNSRHLMASPYTGEHNLFKLRFGSSMSPHILHSHSLILACMNPSYVVRCTPL